MTQPALSIRAASWMAARCVRHFCLTRDIHHQGIESFCRYLESAATASSIVDWDTLGGGLEITGLGDPLPPPLLSVSGLNELLCAAREITSSQMYAAWTPDEVLAFLLESAERSGLNPNSIVKVASSLHKPDEQGWGHPITETEALVWSLEAKEHQVL